MTFEKFLTGKKITVMGIDPDGRGVRDALFCASYGAIVTATDLKAESELGDSVQKLTEAGVVVHLGGHLDEDFTTADLVIRAASAPIGSPYLEKARTAGVRIETDETLFLALAPKVTFVGVTGTRGKSTTTHLLYEIFKKAYPNKTHIAGNVLGLASLPLLPKVHSGDIVVFELASWQLQQFGENKISPDIAVFTTFMPDHLNYYHGDLDAYLKDKAYIFSNQKKENVLVLGEQAAETVQSKYAWHIPSRVIVAKSEVVPSNWKPLIPGAHNLANIACAVEAARAAGVADGFIKDAVESFRGVPGRLEFLQEKDGVRIYNDTTATTPEATIAALRALGSVDRKNIVLIMGGADKGLDAAELIALLPTFCKKIILLDGSGTQKNLAAIQKVVPDAALFNALQPAIKEAFAAAAKGDIILLSPGFASFGMFKNEYDRGTQFVELVSRL